jgi:small subunit ribosomal protein S17
MEEIKQTKDNKRKSKTLKGVVVSDKMKDTVVVEVQGFKKHKRYGKYVKSQKRYKAHDAGNTKKIGDAVTLIETRPISKTKSFKVI